MTDDTLQRLAREAGCFEPNASRNHWAATDEALARFAALVRADALEEAAKVCAARVVGDHNREDAEARRCAEAIRALSVP